MSDDVPIADPLDSKIWMADPGRIWDVHLSRRVWNFVVASCPLISDHLRELGTSNIDTEIFADLAGQASRAKLSDDVIGSLWYLAASRSHVAAAAALIGLLAKSSSPAALRSSIRQLTM